MQPPPTPQGNEARGAEALGETRAAFEYCLGRVGQAADAGPLHRRYIDLLQRERPGSIGFNALFKDPPAGQEEAARSVAVRCGADRSYHPRCWDGPEIAVPCAGRSARQDCRPLWSPQR